MNPTDPSNPNGGAPVDPAVNPGSSVNLPGNDQPVTTPAPETPVAPEVPSTPEPTEPTPGADTTVPGVPSGEQPGGQNPV